MWRDACHKAVNAAQQQYMFPPMHLLQRLIRLVSSGARCVRYTASWTGLDTGALAHSRTHPIRITVAVVSLTSPALSPASCGPAPYHLSPLPYIPLR